MILPLDEIGQFPISLIIIAIIINGIYNHSIYKFIVTFLFEKGLTNRQRRGGEKRNISKENHALHKNDDKESSRAGF